MIITIDGPAGTGKTTVAKRVAEALDFAYFDTGAMYRLVSYLILERDIDYHDEKALGELLQHFSYECKNINGENRYFVDGRDLSSEIRSKEVNQIVSHISALLPVRNTLWKIQRTFGAKGDSVFEGRDMGSVVFPLAEVKIFLTASPEVRAERRLKEILSKDPQEAASVDKEKMLGEIMRRDTLDSERSLAPLKCPEDADQIDTSDLTIDQVVQTILQIVRRK